MGPLIPFPGPLRLSSSPGSYSTILMVYNLDGAPDYWGTLQIRTRLSGKGGGGPLHLYPTLETNKQVKILFYGGEQIHSPGFFKHNIWYSVGAISLRIGSQIILLINLSY